MRENNIEQSGQGSVSTAHGRGAIDSTPQRRYALQLDDVTAQYGKNGAPVLSGVTLNVEHGEFVSILGRSGVGKTTLLRAIAGFERITGGYIRIDGLLMSSKFLCQSPTKRKLGVVFQDYVLFPNMSVKQNILFGLEDVKSAKIRAEYADVLELTGISGLDDVYPSDLSGGQQQRVALARALIRKPQILLLDEPFSNVDFSQKVKMRGELRKILKAANITPIMITHNREDALSVSDKIAVMCDGKIKQFGVALEVYKFPCTYDVAMVCGPCNALGGTYRDGYAATIAGDFKVAAAASAKLRNGDAVSLLIRPTDVDIVPAKEGGFPLVHKAFSGNTFEYEVGLPSGAFKVYKLNVVDINSGERVKIVPRADAEFVALAA